MIRHLAPLAVCVAALAGSTATMAQVEVINFRTGNAAAGQSDLLVGAATGWGLSTPSSPFVAADFQSARSGDTIVGTTLPSGWLSTGFPDQSSRWIGTGTSATPFANGKSALYAFDFYVTTPDPQSSNSSLEVIIAGNGRMGGGPTDAVYLNEQPIQFGSLPLAPEVAQTFTYRDIAPLLRPGLNTLYINHWAQSLPAGIRVSASVRIGASSPCSPQWSTLATPANPAPTGGSGMVYDSARDRVVFYRASTFQSELWEFDGSNWALRSTGGPSPRSGASLAYDAIRQRTVFFGGQPNSGGGQPTDTWEWNGAAWTQVASTGPTARFNASMAYDAARGRVVMAGGQGLSPNTVLAETWAWNGSVWARLTDLPAARTNAAMAYDSSEGRLVMFGGFQPGGSLTVTDTTFVFNGTTWSSLATPLAPEARASAQMAFDSSRGRLVLFGGSNGGLLAGATWELAGNAWSNTAITSPSGRSGFGMTFDSTRNRMVLFGGLNTETGTNLLSKSSVAITTQPLPTTVTERQSIILSVGATSTTGQLNYMWRRNGVPLVNSDRIAGARASILAISGATTADSGVYDVIVSPFNCGSATSSAVLVQVNPCYANCDGSAGPNFLSPADFTCFLNKYRAGCP